MIITSTFLSGCGDKIHEGLIYEKQFSPAESIVVMIPESHVIGNVRTTTLRQHWFHYPDRWCVKIENPESEKVQRATWWIDQKTFNEVQIGEWFIASESSKSTEPELSNRGQK